MGKYFTFAICVLLCGCSTLQVPPEFLYSEIKTSDYTIATWQKITDTTKPYKIYIEGDGHSFDSDGYPTDNPTPKGTLLREIAFGDKHPNVVYLARPCQFVKDSHCKVTDWTTGRFSQQIVSSEYQAVKKIADSHKITLVGFSGGAQIAGLIAVQNPDLNIAKLVTIAGNLDVITWTEYHNVPLLSESLDLHDFKQKYALFPQTHYVGDNDEIVPLAITFDFVADKSNIRLIKGASHNSGWEKAFAAIRGE